MTKARMIRIALLFMLGAISAFELRGIYFGPDECRLGCDLLDQTPDWIPNK